MNYTSFFIYCVIVTFTPGPTNIVILSTVNNHGIKKAMSYVYGATMGFGVLLVLSAVLNTMLISVVPKVLIVLQIAGSIYILYLAFKIYKMDICEDENVETGTFLSGFIMQFINPKVILFTMTVIPSFVMPYFNTSKALTAAAGIITIIGFAAFVTWVLFGIIFKKFLMKYRKTVNMIMALFLVYSALMNLHNSIN